MKVRYVNEQDKSDPMTGAIIAEASELSELLDARRNSEPFIAELFGDNGFELVIGIGSDIGSAQYSRIDGELPYLMALPCQPGVQTRYIEFLINDTPSAIPGRYILSFDEMKVIALHFLLTGQRSDAFAWEET